MNQPSRKIELAVWGGLCLIVLAIFGAYVVDRLKPQLPVYASLADFTLTNQDGRTVTLDDLRGQIWVADAIFTRCPGQCLIMSSHMKQLQAALPASLPIQLVSFTTDPAFDQPAVLKKYGERFGAEDNRWSFLTGSKRELHRVEVDGLRLSVVDKPVADQASPNDLFIHSEKFILLDKQGRVRGYFDGETDDAVAQVAAAARALAND